MKNNAQESLLQKSLNNPPPQEGVLLLNKPKGCTSFSLVSLLRRISHIQKIGHAGTLDPFATGVMVLLIGRDFTKLSDRFLHHDKEYLATLQLGARTDSYDCEGAIIATSSLIPPEQEVLNALSKFQGSFLQTPPMFSAKKVQGKKLYELARKGIEIPRTPTPVTVSITFLSYSYPFLSLKVSCSKGTYIRSLAEDIGLHLGCGAHLFSLTRTRSGPFSLSECHDPSTLSLPLPLLDSIMNAGNEPGNSTEKF